MSTQPFADAQSAFPFVVQQSRNIETRIYQKRYPPYLYGQVVPVVTEGNPWAIGTQFYTADMTGEAKFISGAASDMPYNEVTRDTAAHDYSMVGAAWQWNIEEVNQAALYGIGLQDGKAMAASMSIERLLYNIAMTGSTEKNWTGFVNNGTVSRADVPADGASASTFWSEKDNVEIVRDMNLALTTVRTQTGEVEYADTLALPPEAFRYIASVEYGSGNGTLTILEFFRRNNVYTAETGQPLTILSVRALATASNDGGGRMVAYRRAEEVLKFHLPMPKRVLPVHQKSLMGFEQGAIARTGGTEIRLPGAMTYLDEITAPPA